MQWLLVLRPYLSPKGITVEPEGHMAADKRADISVAMPARKVPCELKGDYHPDLWTAADKQPEALYSRDPESKGFGVYGVFWFGDKRPVPISKHPYGLSRPHSAAELEQMLRDRIPADRRNRLNVQCHLTSASTHRGFRAAATNIWRATVEVA